MGVMKELARIPAFRKRSQIPLQLTPLPEKGLRQTSTKPFNPLPHSLGDLPVGGKKLPGELLLV